MERRRLALGAGALVVLVVGGTALAGAIGDGGSAEASPGRQFVDYGGVRFEVPEDFVVQATAGRVDGQLACPDAPGYVFTDDGEREFYTDATCDPPGDQVLVGLVDVEPGLVPVEPMPAPSTSPGGVDYVRFEPTGIDFVDADVWVTATGPGAEELVTDIAESAEPSPDDAPATPTTAQAETAVTDRLADELGCEATEIASTYARGGAAPFLGRQAEAPVDCRVGDHGFRILVFRDDDAVGLARGYYSDGAWLIVGDRWVVTAMDDEAAALAEERTGGEALPPDHCCGPPTSDDLPGTNRSAPATIP